MKKWYIVLAVGLLCSSLFFVKRNVDALNYGEVTSSVGTSTKLLARMNATSSDSSGLTIVASDTATTYGLPYGRFGNGLLITATTTKVIYTTSTLGNAASIFNASSTIFVSMWVKFLNVTGASNVAIFDMGGGTTSFGLEVALNGSSQKLVMTQFRRGQASISATGNTTIVVGKWYNIILTSDGKNTYNMYVNGHQDITPFSGVLATVANGQGICVNVSVACATDPAGGDGTLNGNYYFDELVVRKDVLVTPTQIQQYYSQSLGRYSPR